VIVAVAITELQPETKNPTNAERRSGSCFVTGFSGPHAEARARAYHDALRNGTVAAFAD
jgi:hypothetical protein